MSVQQTSNKLQDYVRTVSGKMGSFQIVLAVLTSAATYWWISTRYPQEAIDASIAAFLGAIAVCAAFIVAGVFAIMTTFKWQEASVSERIAGMAPLAVGVLAIVMMFVATALSI
jgi:hypothetical protein